MNPLCACGGACRGACGEGKTAAGPGGAWVTLHLRRPWRLEGVAAAYYAAREAYAEYLARRAGLEVSRNWSCAGEVELGLSGPPEAAAACAAELARNGVGGFGVEAFGEVAGEVLARIGAAARLELEGEGCAR